MAALYRLAQSEREMEAQFYGFLFLAIIEPSQAQIQVQHAPVPEIQTSQQLSSQANPLKLSKSVSPFEVGAFQPGRFILPFVVVLALLGSSECWCLCLGFLLRKTTRGGQSEKVNDKI